jgi:hypothetical protein
MRVTCVGPAAVVSTGAAPGTATGTVTGTSLGSATGDAAAGAPVADTTGGGVVATAPGGVGSTGAVELALGPGVALAAGVAAGVEVGLALGVGLDVALGVGVAVAAELGVGVGPAGAPAAVTRFVTAVRQVTVAPPPLPLLLHWLIDTGSAVVWVEVSTVHCTRMLPPPPFPLPLHWSTVALVVFPTGLHDTVGAVPPPAPLPLHWLIVAGCVVAEPVMLFVTVTLQRATPPPPLALPLHWLTTVVGCGALLVLVVQVPGVLAAPVQAVTVVVELPTPVATSYELVIVTSQATCWPPTLAMPLHCDTDVAACAAGADRLKLAADMPPVRTTIPISTERRTRRRAWRGVCDMDSAVL